jgi:hypothetical protein
MICDARVHVSANLKIQNSNECFGKSQMIFQHIKITSLFNNQVDGHP